MCCAFNTGSPFVAQIGLKLAILLRVPLQSWDIMCESLPGKGHGSKVLKCSFTDANQ